MPLNEKQEKFAEAYVLHRNATEAAKSAGYSAASANNQGYRLMHMQEVIDRVHELEQELETDVNVIEEIESQYTFAKANGHTNSAIKALELLSRIRGSNSDSSSSMDKDTLETAIVGCLNVLGEDKVVRLLSKCEFANALFEEDNVEEEVVEDYEDEKIMVEENE
jgi:phage terminase small subunit